MRIHNPLVVKFTPVALLVCLVLIAGTCKKRTDKNYMDFTKAIVGKTWLHSHEDDRGDTLTYRPNSYDFPPSRGRTGFAFDHNGLFTQFDIAPTDGLEGRKGQWQAIKENTLRITLEDQSQPDYTLEIVSLEPALLKVRRVE